MVQHRDSRLLSALERIDELVNASLDGIATLGVILRDRREAVPLGVWGAGSGSRALRYIERDDVRGCRQVGRSKALWMPGAQFDLIQSKPPQHPRRNDRINMSAA